MNLDLTTLREMLPHARWFGDKDRDISSLETIDVGVLDEGDESLALALVRVDFADGDSAVYHLPVLVNREGGTRDAGDDPDRLRLLGEMLAHGHPVKGERGIFHFSGPGLDPGDPPGRGSVWKISAEQSNTSVVFDDSVILKFFRKIEPGSNPDLELTRLLTNEGFRSVPPHLGEIFYEETPGEETTGPEAEIVSYDLGLAQRFVHGGREGWEVTLEYIGRMLDEIHEADTPEDMILLIEERSGELLTIIEQLGEVTASLHVTLAREDMEAEFRPEVVENDDLRSWVEGALIRLHRLAPEVPELASHQDKITSQLEALAGIDDAGYMTRIHGDYHLGQVLRVPRLWYILDFEGEPARPLNERRAKQSPLKDAAGMMRSLSYAATAVLFDRAEPDSDEWRRLEPWALTWEELARERFLAAYLARSHEGRFLPGDPDSVTALLDLFELDKAIYEVDYERRSRPEWVRIPLRGIQRVVERGEER